MLDTQPATKETLAREQLMLEQLYAAAKVFYANPINQKAYEAWKNNKEDIYATNNNNY